MSNCAGKVVKIIRKFSFWLMAMLLAPLTLQATPFINPDPLIFHDDTDGSGYFEAAGTASIGLGFFDLGLVEIEFGIYAQDDPAVFIPIFEASDNSGDAAIIDFAGGFIHDLEEGAVQNNFTPIATFGFYLNILDAGVSTILYSNSALNGLAGDRFSSYRSLSDDTSTLVFWTGNNEPISLHVITDINAVPEPWLFPLLAIGLAAVAARRLQGGGEN
jgi:hypothetical protein